MADAVTALKDRLATLSDLRNASLILEWDQQTMMPPGGYSSRAEAMATLGRLGHELFAADETGRLLEAAATEVDGADPDSDDAALIRVVTRRWHKLRRVPAELEAEMARAAAKGHEAWVAARAASDFATFAPFLGRNVELVRRYVEYLPEFDHPYDALLDDYDAGLRSDAVTAIFAELKAALVPLITTVASVEPPVDSVLYGDFPEERQRRLALAVLARMGFTPERWRLDEAAHPFATHFGPGDIRLTTRWDRTYFPAGLYGVMHECGHGLYDAGVSVALDRTPIGAPTSLGLHESQSRLWENLVGRSRPFAEVLAPLIHEHLGVEVTPDALFRAVNRVTPSFIRVEADEATYGLHIVLRYELEQELVEGRLRVADLPEAWNERFRAYFGLEVPDDTHGVLQDVHWAGGSIGYFPTYALGNLIAGQLWERVGTDLPDLDAQLAAGELMPLREWLREHVHRHGSKFQMPELLARVVGGPITVAPFVRYLQAKLGEVYGLDLAGAASAGAAAPASTPPTEGTDR